MPMLTPPSAAILKFVLFCAFCTISASAREVSLMSVLRTERLVLTSFSARLCLMATFLVNRRISFGASGMVLTSLPAW